MNQQAAMNAPPVIGPQDPQYVASGRVPEEAITIHDSMEGVERVSSHLRDRVDLLAERLSGVMHPASEMNKTAETCAPEAVMSDMRSRANGQGAVIVRITNVIEDILNRLEI